MRKALIVALSLFWASGAWAEAPQFKIDAANSSIAFIATQNAAPAKGEFKIFGGIIRFDPVRPAESSADIAVDMASVATSYAEMTEGLKTDDWFNVQAFPKAKFTASSFRALGDRRYEAVGALTIRDKTIPLILPFTLTKYENDQAEAEARITLKRSDFGIGQGEWAKPEPVKNEVDVILRISATRVR